MRDQARTAAEAAPPCGAERILVIKLGALGDFVQAMGPAAAIRAHHERAEITLLTTAPFVELARAAPYFDRIWVDERPGLADPGALWLQDQRLAQREGHALPHQILGRIGSGGNADKCADALGPGERHQQHEPAADARSDQHELALGEAVDHRERIVAEAADRRLGEIAGGGAMGEVIEAQEGAVILGAKPIQGLRLGARHVGVEAGKEQDAGPAPAAPAVGDCRSVLAC